MNYIFQNISISFANLGIFPDSNIKLKNTFKKYEEVEIQVIENKSYILRDGYYPELIKYFKIEDDLKIEKYKKNGKYHRDNGPSMIYRRNNQITLESYRQNGILHRLEYDKPCVIYYKNNQITLVNYYENGFLQRPSNSLKKGFEDDKPSIIEYGENGEITCEEFFRNGKHHRSSGVFQVKPTIIEYENGQIVREEYHENGEYLELTSFPSIIKYRNGRVIKKKFYENGECSIIHKF